MVFVVLAKKFGLDNSHSYIVAVHTSKKNAEHEADAHSEYRGGKYLCEVQEFEFTKKDPTILVSEDSQAVNSVRVYKNVKTKC